MAVDLKDIQDTANAVGAKNVGSAIGSIGSSAATGVALGSVVPGIGNVVGGIVGAIGGIFSSIFGGGGPTLQEREAKEQSRVNALSKPLQDKYYSNKEYVWAQQKAIDDSDREYNWAHRNDPGFTPVNGRKFADPNAGKDYIDILESEAGISSSSSSSGSGGGLDVGQSLNSLLNLTDKFSGLFKSSATPDRAPAGSAIDIETGQPVLGKNFGDNNFSSPSSLLTSNVASGLIIGGVVIFGLYLYKKGALK